MYAGTVEIHELEPHEQVALVALLGLMARLDFQDEAAIEHEVDELAASIGPRFVEIADAATSLSDGRAILDAAAKVKRPDARSLIFETLYRRAAAETIVDSEQQMLERVAQIWHLSPAAAPAKHAHDVAKPADAPVDADEPTRESPASIPATAPTESPEFLEPEKPRAFEFWTVMCLYYLPAMAGMIASAPWPARAALDSTDRFLYLTRSVFTAVALVFVMVRSGDPLARFGLVRTRWYSVVFGGALLSFVTATISYACWLIGLIPSDGPPHHTHHDHVQGAFILIAAQTLASATVQELAMRGYLITRFEDRFHSRGVSITLAALLFASYHAYQGLGGTMDAFIMGVVFGIAFCWQRSLAPLIFAHTVYNLLVTFR